MGERLVGSNRKTGVIELITAVTSACCLLDKLVASSSAPLKYLLAYKFSQDHIELFVGDVRGRGRWNNNPTARQFKAAYKRLLMHQHVKAVATGNVLPLEPVELLTVSSHIERAQNFADSDMQCMCRIFIVRECNTLISNGIILDGVHVKIVIYSLVCDAPARAFMKCIKPHNGYFSCERCCVEGECVNHCILLQIIMRSQELMRNLLHRQTHTIRSYRL